MDSADAGAVHDSVTVLPDACAVRFPGALGTEIAVKSFGSRRVEEKQEGNADRRHAAKSTALETGVTLSLPKLVRGRRAVGVEGERPPHAVNSRQTPIPAASGFTGVLSTVVSGFRLHARSGPQAGVSTSETVRGRD